MKCSSCNYQYFKRNDGVVEIGNKPFEDICIGERSLFACPNCGMLRIEKSDKEVYYETDR
jgi:predicted RNA-binding Zn-ribbon protein involved in translation (DUF1610 family)